MVLILVLIINQCHFNELDKLCIPNVKTPVHLPWHSSLPVASNAEQADGEELVGSISVSDVCLFSYVGCIHSEYTVVISSMLELVILL